MSQNGEPKIRGAVVGAGHMGQYHILALAEIWGVESDPSLSIAIDAWESYLEPA